MVDPISIARGQAEVNRIEGIAQRLERNPQELREFVRDYEALLSRWNLGVRPSPDAIRDLKREGGLK